MRMTILLLAAIASVSNITTPDAKLFVMHLESMNHNSVTREMVRKRAEVARILDRVFIPEDGETVEDL